MEQVYYTQCPMGYGLGAAGGFQLKRISRGYPRSVDFRHLGLRVQMAGLKVASPKVLRYRLDGEIAEVAWLAPREKEFEVAAGDGSTTRQYGRPGGLFAHGLRLAHAEQEALESWPAGLLGWPCWIERDGRPTAGQFLEPLELTRERLDARPRPPRFDAVAPLAEPWGREFLARLLASVAQAVRLGRVLFLIDAPGDPGRVGDLVALLTFAFPPALRRELTFSTYHDRAEGLPGFRIQGLPASVRTDRGTLRALGTVADLAASTVEPDDETPAWADRLAGWLIERNEVAWRATCLDLFPRVKPHEPASERWEVGWLDHLFLFRERNAGRPESLADRATRTALLGSIEWAARSGLASEWASAHPPTWWRAAATSGTSSGTACSILLRQGPLAESWSVAPGVEPDAATATSWGEVVALWFGQRPASDWGPMLRAFLAGAPATTRLRFITSLLRSEASRADLTLDWIESHGGLDRERLLILRTLRHVSPRFDQAGVAGLLAKALGSAARAGSSDGLARTLRTIARELDARPDDWPAFGESIASGLAQARESLGPGEFGSAQRRVMTWALAQPRANELIGPHVRDLVEELDGVRSLQAIRDSLPAADRLMLIRAALTATEGKPALRVAFRHVVELLLLPAWNDGPVPETRWADPYVAAFESDRELLTRLDPSRSLPRLGEWLDMARRIGDLGEASEARLARVEGFLQVLSTRDPERLTMIELPQVRPADRSWLLGLMLGTIGRSSIDAALACLDACRLAWPEGVFAETGRSRVQLAAAIAEALARLAVEPGAIGLDFEQWRSQLVRVLDRLGIDSDSATRFRPDSLAAELIAATARLDFLEPQRWPFRREVLHDAELSRTLAADIGRDLQPGGREPAGPAFELWDHNLEVGTLRARFLETFLNACDDPAFIAVARARAGELRDFGPLAWWDHGRVSGARDDLRDRLARVVPMRPLPFVELMRLLLWFEPDELRLEPGEGLEAVWPPLEGRALKDLSPQGRTRWLCLEGLSEIASREWVKWPMILGKVERLPLAQLEPEDRYTLAAWLIYRAEAESVEAFNVAGLSLSLARLGLDDPARLSAWFERLPPDLRDLGERVRARSAFVEGLASALA